MDIKRVFGVLLIASSVSAGVARADGPKSEVINGSALAPPHFFTINVGTRTSVSGERIQLCEAICISFVQCVAWYYENSGTACRLKDSVSFLDVSSSTASDAIGYIR